MAAFPHCKWFHCHYYFCISRVLNQNCLQQDPLEMHKKSVFTKTELKIIHLSLVHNNQSNKIQVKTGYVNLLRLNLELFQYSMSIFICISRKIDIRNLCYKIDYDSIVESMFLFHVTL